MKKASASCRTPKPSALRDPPDWLAANGEAPEKIHCVMRIRRYIVRPFATVPRRRRDMRRSCMFSRSRRTVAHSILVLVAFAIASFAQNPPGQSKKGYKRPTIKRGSPGRPLTGPAAGRPVDLAANYLREHGNDADLTDADVADLVVTSETKSKHNGISHVYLRQRVDGLEVFGADSNFNVGANGALLSFGTSFLPGVRESITSSTAEIDASTAASAALAHVGLSSLQALEVVEVKSGPEQETVLTDGGIAQSPIIAKLVYQP